MITHTIEKQEELTNKVIELLLIEYNKGLEEPLLLIEKTVSACFSEGLEYTFYRAVGDMPGQYEQGNSLSESKMMKWLSQELNERDRKRYADGTRPNTGDVTEQPN
jgi:hypothetical protein